LKEMLRPVVPHPEEKFFLQHGDVMVAVSHTLGGGKKEREPLHPHHDTGGVLDDPDCVALLILIPVNHACLYEPWD
jgi:hypothetical protein